MDGLRELWNHVGISGYGVLGVVVSSTVLYLLYTAVLRFAGQRFATSPSVLSFSMLALLGALCARAMLGEFPTLLGALVAVATLLVLEFSLGRLRAGLGRLVALRGQRPTVVMVHGHVIHWNLRHHGMHEDELLPLLRRAGLMRVREAELVILEPRGGLTILRAGETIDERLLGDVRGAELIPSSLRA